DPERQEPGARLGHPGRAEIGGAGGHGERGRIPRDVSRSRGAWRSRGTPRAGPSALSWTGAGHPADRLWTPAALANCADLYDPSLRHDPCSIGLAQRHELRPPCCRPWPPPPAYALLCSGAPRPRPAPRSRSRPTSHTLTRWLTI